MRERLPSDSPFFSQQGVNQRRVAEDWIKIIEKLFDVIVITTEQRVQLATFMLGGLAECWWNLKKGTLISPITWEVFLEVFNAEYFLDFLRQ